MAERGQELVLAAADLGTGVGPLLLERERAVAARAGRPESASALGAPLALVAFLAIFPLVGVPLSWTLHLRVAVTADGPRILTTEKAALLR